MIRYFFNMLGIKEAFSDSTVGPVSGVVTILMMKTGQQIIGEVIVENFIGLGLQPTELISVKYPLLVTQVSASEMSLSSFVVGSRNWLYPFRESDVLTFAFPSEAVINGYSQTVQKKIEAGEFDSDVDDSDDDEDDSDRPAYDDPGDGSMPLQTEEKKPTLH